MKQFIILLLAALTWQMMYSQETDEQTIRRIFDDALTHDDAYGNLHYLCEETPGRLIGSEASLQAQQHMKEYFKSLGADTVWYQDFTAPAWKCEKTMARLVNEDGSSINLNCVALGTSPSTPDNSWLLANVVEVKSLDEVRELGKEKISGKIVFYNRHWDPKIVNTFRGYGNTVDQRSPGPAVAAEQGAVAVIVRSVTNSTDDFPHTGTTRFGDVKIPAIAISTMDADVLSKTLREQPNTKVRIVVKAEDIEVNTHNLIAEIRGSEFPDEYILVGGHIDAWHNSPGAHDDGAGCVMSADVMRIFKNREIKNRHTIRVVLFMDEEMYQSGGKAYARYVKEHQENNIFALEADEGAFTPRQFTVNAPEEVVNKLAAYQPLLEPYGICKISAGWGGVDIGPLKDLGVALAGYGTDPQRYFDMHHSPNDTFENVNLRELQLGCGNMTAFIYLVDKYWGK